MSKASFNLKIGNNQLSKTTTVVALIIMLTITTFSAGIATVGAASTVTLRVSLSHQVIGVNQPLGLGIVTTGTGSNIGEPYGLKGEDFVWPSAYAVFTRPDGTNVTLNGPFQISSTQMTSLRFTFTPDMVGEWKIMFVWPGDINYSPASVQTSFDVQQQPVPKRDTWAYLSLRPYPTVGINQQLLVNAWVTPPPIHTAEYYENYTFTIIKPDGSTAYKFSMNSESPGTAWWEFYFDQLGNWSIKFEFPGTAWDKACSITRTITVQQDPISYPVTDTPFPTEAWTFPISPHNREWRNIAGPWYMTNYNSSKGAWNPYSEAPKTAHVLWKLNPVSGLGGYIGATSGNSGIGTSNMFSSTAANIRTVMAGRGYYTANNIIYCVDMRTGEKLWMVNGSFNVGATRDGNPVLYQFGSTFRVYDALTGATLLSVPGMAMAADLFDGTYVYSTQNYIRFNVNQSFGTTPDNLVPYKDPRIIKWTTEGTTNNFTERIIWNISAPINNIESGFCALHDNLIVGVDWYSQAIATYTVWAINATTGEMVYNKDTFDNANPNTWVYKQGPMIGTGYGKIYWAALPHENEGRGWTAYDVATGDLSWVSEETEYPWGAFWAYMPESCGYGMMFGLSYDGVYAFNASNGKIVWHYSAGNSGMETPYNTWAFGSVGPVIGGGIVFAPNTEHTPTLYYRGQQLHAIDAFTGNKVWSIMGVYTPTALAYGTLVAIEASGFTFAFGKGETATTVAVQNDVYAKGSSILIKGTVMDLSSAQPNTPAVSDDSMTAWMEYLHMQQPKPTNTTGVPVRLAAVDADGKSTDLGTVVSDASGNYAYMWTPQAEGVYRIVASFEGSESYYGSSAETVVGVGSAAAGSSPSVTEPPTSPSTTDSPSPTTTTSASPTGSAAPTSSPSAIPGPESTTGTEVYIAIAAAVIIVAVIAVALVLRRRSK